MSPSSLHAIQYLEQYLNGIILQWNRIVTAAYQSTNSLISGSSLRVHLGYQEELDFHFYRICWDKVLKYFGLVAKLERDAGISKSFTKVSKLLHEAKQGRNFYEHLDLEFRRGGIGTRGRGFNSPEGYHFSFVEVRSGRPVEKKVNLGMDEIRRVSEAYENVIVILEARANTR